MSDFIKNYEDFNYNSEFIPQYNIFNVNTESIKGNVGIGENNPKNIIDIKKDNVFRGNINMNGNIYLNKENKNLNDGFIKVLFYNKLSQTIDIGSLKYTSPYKTEIGFKKNNDSLTLEPIDNKTNSNIFKIFRFNSSYSNSLEFNKTKNELDLNIVSKSKLFLKHISIYDDLNQTNFVDNILLSELSGSSNIKTSIDITNQGDGIYKLNKPYILEPNTFNKFNIENITPNLCIELTTNYDYDAGSYWYNSVNSNKYINRNVSINKKDNIQNDFHVEGNTFVSNNVNVKESNIDNLINVNTLNVNKNLNTNKLESENNLLIEGKNLYINSDSIDNVLCKLVNTNIDNHGNMSNANIFIENNLNVNRLEKTGTYNKINFDSNSLRVNSVYYQNTQIDANDLSNPPSIEKNLIGVNDSNIYLNSKVLVNNDSSNINMGNNLLYVNNYDVITDDLDYTNLLYSELEIKNNNNISQVGNLNVNHLNIGGILNAGNRLEVDNINVDDFKTNNLDFNKINNSNDSKVGDVYVKSDNKLYGTYRNNQEFQFLEKSQTKSKITDSLDIDNLETNNLDAKNIQTSSVRTKEIILPRTGYIENFIPDNKVGKLNISDNNYVLNDGNSVNKLQFNDFDDYYIVEFKYNKIKLEDQFSSIFTNLNALYNVEILNNNDLRITYNRDTNIVNNVSNLFYIRNNKLYTNENQNTFITIFNVVKVNNETFNANYKFDKLFDSNDLIYVNLTQYDLESKTYTITTLPSNNQSIRITINESQIGDNNSDKYKIKNYELFDLNNNSVSIYLYNIVYKQTNIEATLIKGNIVNNTITNENISINSSNTTLFGYSMDYLNHNGIYKIKNNKLFTVLNTNTNLKVTEKRLISNNVYEAKISNSYLNS